MSGANNSLRNISRLLLALCASLIGWVLIAPVAALVPRRRDWIAVIGRQKGEFLDNAKYFFLYAKSTVPDLRIAFITERNETEKLLSHYTHDVLRFPKLQAIWFLLRCGSVVVDEAAWFRKFRFFLLVRAKFIQLWHGVGFKWIEAGLWRHDADNAGPVSWRITFYTRLLIYWITGRRVRYAVVATTSNFYRENVFRPTFTATVFPLTGYPRNDFALSLDSKFHGLAWCNVDATVRSHFQHWQHSNRRLVLVAPTFRESGSIPMQLDSEILRAVDTFAEIHSVEFIFKFHPLEHNIDHINGRHFHVCARDSDIYPILPYIDALVTDYSSISMDFLFVDKPLIFFIPNDDNYPRKDRRLQFDPRTMMPGPIVPDWASLLDALLSEWANDAHANERATLRRKAFDDLPQSEATSKLITLMRKKGWISTTQVTDTH